jgi:hypothetical protein
MFETLEKFRINDCMAYRKQQEEIAARFTSINGPSEVSEGPKSLFHHFFNIENGVECPID